MHEHDSWEKQQICLSTISAIAKCGPSSDITSATYSFSLKTMLLGSSFQLPPPVLVIPSPSDVLLGTWVGSPSGGWMGAVSVLWYTVQRVFLFLVGLPVLSQLRLGLGLEQALLPSLQHWVVLQQPHWMVHWLSVSGQPLTEMLGIWLERIQFRSEVSSSFSLL